MKKIICSLLCFIFSAAIVLADDPLYEKKLEYKRKKLEILVKTSYIGRESDYVTTDYFETVYTPEASSTYKYGYSTSQRSGTKYLQEVTDWKIMRGGIRELNDAEFLEIVGQPKKAEEIRKINEGKNAWLFAGGIIGIAGIGIMVASASQGNSGAATTGAAVSLLGILISSFNAPKRHYISADYAQELADNYNVSLKRQLGIPIETE